VVIGAAGLAGAAGFGCAAGLAGVSVLGATETGSSADEAKLTVRQKEVLDLLADGKSNKQIASALGISEGTVKVHVNATFRVLGVHNRVNAAAALMAHSGSRV